MPIPWAAAFKAIPWAKVVASAPAIVEGARVLVGAVRKAPPAAPGDSPDDALAARVAELEAEQAASTALIRSLAEQNEQLVNALEVVRLRTRLLMGVSAVLAVAVVVLAVAMLA